MDEARYWMWVKSNRELNQNPRVLVPSPAVNCSGDSWEEQAFAEDAAGALGGCVWPPRSYSCTFCRRDFRSAQALGGHMNVHRRDRARLKQSPGPNPKAEIVPQNHNHGFNPCASFDPPYSSQMCSFIFSNPNPEFSDTPPRFASGVFRVSSPPPAAAAEKVSSTLCFFSQNQLQKTDKESLVLLEHPPPWSSFLSEKRDRDGEKKSTVADPDSRAEKEADCVTEDLQMSLDLVVRKTETKEEVASFKRRRIEAKPLNPVERCLPQPEVLKLCYAGSAADDLDLELRLGDAPKVK